MPGSDSVWDAFWLLVDDRPWVSQGFGLPMGGTLIEPVPRRISYLAISTFARDVGIRGEDFDRLVRLIRELDEEYMEISAEQMRARWEKMQK